MSLHPSAAERASENPAAAARRGTPASERENIRPARPDDLHALLALENRLFVGDRISKRSFRHFLRSPSAVVLMAEHGGQPAGYVLVLFRPGSMRARLYSVAVAPEAAGRRLGRALLEAAEDAARARGRLRMRLEVDERNARALTLYRKAGYREIGVTPSYYEDGGTALRLEKELAVHEGPSEHGAPYFHQTTDFTCGPACMLMALAWAGQPIEAGPAFEYQLWREATTIFTAAGPGGCDPFGLAVALARRGLRTEIFVNHPGPYFLDSVRSEEKRRVMRVIQADFRQQAEALNIPVHLRALEPEHLLEALHSGACAIVLVAGYRLLPRDVPHWVFVPGSAEDSILIHDPEPARDGPGEPAPSRFVLPASAFARISRYGRQDLRAALVIRKG